MLLLNRHLPRLLALLGAWLAFADDVSAQLSREYDVKAVFLYNFISFVEWPESAFSGAEAPFVLGILGQDPFGRVIDDVIAGERVKNRPVLLKRLSRVEDCGSCHILFVSASEKRSMREVLNRCRRSPVLTVADMPEFVEAGGVVGFRVEENRLKIDVNAESARMAGLTISSKLLKVARVIGETPR